MGNQEKYFFETKQLTVGYNGKPLISNISFGLKKGQIMSLIGPNGAGKTTIIRSLIRQLPTLGGTVWLGGDDVSGLSGKQMAQKLAIVLTEKIKPELMTCADVVATGRYPYTGRFGVLSEADNRIVEQTMEMCRIEYLRDRSFEQISDGQRQRVMLARALCQEPELLILDEPTSFLDIRYKLEFLSLLQSLSRQRQMTVILSLHELDLAERISDEVLCVKGKYVDRFGTPEEIFREDYISQLYEVSAGTYDTGSGSPELQRPEGEPKVFVIAGNGSGAPVFRHLQRAGIPFAAGILWENDRDYPSAKALAQSVISVPAFCEIDEKQMGEALRLMDRCESVLCPVDLPDTAVQAEFLRRLRDHAAAQGKLA